MLYPMDFRKLSFWRGIVCGLCLADLFFLLALPYPSRPVQQLQFVIYGLLVILVVIRYLNRPNDITTLGTPSEVRREPSTTRL